MTSYPTASSSEALCVVPSLLMTVLLIGTASVGMVDELMLKYRFYVIDNHMLDNPIVKWQSHDYTLFGFPNFEYLVLSRSICQTFQFPDGFAEVFLSICFKLQNLRSVPFAPPRLLICDQRVLHGTDVFHKTCYSLHK